MIPASFVSYTLTERESLTAQSPATRSIWRERNKAGEWLTTGLSL